MLKEMDLYRQIAVIILIVGGICWGLVGIFNVFLLTSIFGVALGRILYIIVFLAAVYLCYEIYLEKFKKP
jgi:uncharacterized membrane protein YuzA (DUF378 family)